MSYSQRRIPQRMAALLLICASGLLTVCGCTRTVYVPEGDPVQLRQAVKGVKIWAWDKDGKRVPGKMDLPEGWHALPDPGPGD